MLKVIKEKFNSGMGRDVVWTFSIQILIMLCSFAINKLLANRLSIDDFGQYNVIKRSVQVLSFVMLAGVGIALPRYIPLYRNGTPPRRIAPLLTASMIYIIGVSLVVFLVCILFSTQMQDVVIGQGGNMNLLAVGHHPASRIAARTHRQQCLHLMAYHHHSARGVLFYKRGKK